MDGSLKIYKIKDVIYETSSRNAERVRFLIAPDIRHPNRRTTKAAGGCLFCSFITSARVSNPNPFPVKKLQQPMTKLLPPA